MKRVYGIFFCLVTYLLGFSQTVMNSPTHMSSIVNTCNFGLPVARSVNGGAKIIVDYEGDWPLYMKTAFQHACEIWEEAMPTTIPIRVTAYMEESACDSDLLSDVSVAKQNISCPYAPQSVDAQLKSLIYNDVVRSVNHNYADSVDISFFENEDFNITYYKDIIDENCSFWLSNTCESGKYDFVTVALRDLAKGFGLIWDINLEIQSIVKSNLTSFQRFVDDALMPYTNRLQALNKATKGSLGITDGENISYSLYAPAQWNNNESLRYFIPNSTKKITQLMRYDFGRETLVRNLNDANMHWFFRSLLNWLDFGVATGGEFDYQTTSASTSNVLDCQTGHISIEPAISNSNKNISRFLGWGRNAAATTTNYDYNYYVGRFTPTYWGIGGWTVSVMNNDGSWTLLHSQPTNTSLNINISSLNIGNLSNYSVTCDGLLRFRVVYNDSYNNILQEYYYLVNCPPRKVSMRKEKILPIDDEYVRDVVIGLGNLEGVTRIVVEQKDQGDVPIYYEVPDFKKGFFVATVDKELSSEFRIRAYNSKGNVWSNKYTLPALQSSSNGFTPEFRITDENISVRAKASRLYDKELYRDYIIRRLSTHSYNLVSEGMINSDGNINISSLPNALYSLEVTDINGVKHTMKFTKQ